MSQRRNPFPGVTRVIDRHDKVRWRFRKKGMSLYLPGDYGSVEFRAAYEAAIGGVKVSAPSRFEYGTFGRLAEDYKSTPTWQKLAKISRKTLVNQMEHFLAAHGTKKVAHLKPEHVEALIAKKAATPAAANRQLKLLRRLCRFAIRRGLITTDPTIGVERYKENPDGFHTWTDDEIIRFEDHHGVGSTPVLALRLILCTGAARQDVIGLGWQSIKNGRIAYRRHKTGGDVDLPILDELHDVLEGLPKDRMLFITYRSGRPYKPETFGNWFRDQCVAAKLPPECSAHGLRKAGATRLANAGCTELEIMAFLGHTTPDEARTYVKKFNRAHLADTGMEKLVRAKGERGLSNQVARLDSRRRKALNSQET